MRLLLNKNNQIETERALGEIRKLGATEIENYEVCATVSIDLAKIGLSSYAFLYGGQLIIINSKEAKRVAVIPLSVIDTIFEL